MEFSAFSHMMQLKITPSSLSVLGGPRDYNRKMSRLLTLLLNLNFICILFVVTAAKQSRILKYLSYNLKNYSIFLYLIFGICYNMLSCIMQPSDQDVFSLT